MVLAAVSVIRECPLLQSWRNWSVSTTEWSTLEMVGVIFAQPSIWGTMILWLLGKVTLFTNCWSPMKTSCKRTWPPGKLVMMFLKFWNKNCRVNFRCVSCCCVWVFWITSSTRTNIQKSQVAGYSSEMQWTFGENYIFLTPCLDWISFLPELFNCSLHGFVAPRGPKNAFHEIGNIQNPLGLSDANCTALTHHW